MSFLCNEALPDKVGLKNCSNPWEQIHRIVMVHPSASLQDGASADLFAAADADAYKTNIETEAQWDTLFGLSDLDKGVITGEINQHNLPMGEIVTNDLPDGEQLFNRINGRTGVFSFYNPSQVQEAQLSAFKGKTARVAFLTKSGYLIAPKFAVASGTATATQPFFDAVYLAASDPARVSGSPDQQDLQIRFAQGVLTEWDVFTTPFLLTK